MVLEEFRQQFSPIVIESQRLLTTIINHFEIWTFEDGF